jgi:hypothetical protein
MVLNISTVTPLLEKVLLSRSNQMLILLDEIIRHVPSPFIFCGDPSFWLT